MIEVKNLKKSFYNIDIIKDISLVFESGKTNLIIGQSGSGKTVLLKCLLNLFKPSFGEIFFEGLSTINLDFNSRKILQSNIGTVFQGGALFDSMTVEENIMFPLIMLTNQSNFEIKKKVNEVLYRVNLKNDIYKYPSELSGGMQKRVAVARAIVNNPKFLFCDEPNSGLDPKNAILIDKLIYDITKEYNITTVINTHDMNSVIGIGENIFFLKNGFNVWEGNSKNIFKTKNKDVVDFLSPFNFLIKKLCK